MRKLFALFFFLCLAGSASAQPFSAIWVFGGPLEDVGNYASVNGGTLPPPFFNNRFSDGPLAIEILAGQLGFTLTPSLHRIGPPQGNDFASADALASGPDPKDLQGQINAYFTLSHNLADPKALYYMIIGGNEVIAATYEQNDAKSLAILKAAVASKKLAVERLVQAGAKNLFIDNFFNLGRTPQLINAGLTTRATKMSQIHNRLMWSMLDQAERDLDFNLIRFDVYEFGEKVIAAADRLRITNTTQSCLALLPSGQCDFQHFAFFTDLTVTARVGEFWGFALVDAVEKNSFEQACRKRLHLNRWPFPLQQFQLDLCLKNPS